MRVFKISAFLFFIFSSMGDLRVYTLKAQRDILFIGVFPYIVIMDSDCLASRSQLTFLVFMMKLCALNALQLCGGFISSLAQRAK